MSEELKPCPFCGGEARLVHCMNAPCRVVCEECGCGTRWFACDGREHAIDEWNRRAERTCHPVDYHIDIDEGCIASTCSECGELLVNFDFEQNPPKPVGYCPNCGAEVTE